MPAALPVAFRQAAGRTEIMSSTVCSLHLLELFSTEPFEWGLSEIAQALSLSKATSHRILATLMEAGFVSQEPIRHRYFVSGKALEVGTGFLRHSPAYRAAFPVMHQLGERDRGHRTLRCVGSRHDPISPQLWATERLLPLRRRRRPPTFARQCHGQGNAGLGSRNRSGPHHVRWLRALHGEDNHHIGCYAARTGRRPEEGYAINDEEWCLGLRAVASPIFGARREVVASICIGGPAIKMSAARLVKFGALVREAGMQISRQLSYRPTHGAECRLPRT
jgi:IclR family KDG regulon transcriptional repressor